MREFNGMKDFGERARPRQARLALSALFLLLVSLALAGCAGSKIPAPEPAPRDALEGPRKPSAGSGASGSSTEKTADSVSGKTADKTGLGLATAIPEPAAEPATEIRQYEESAKNGKAAVPPPPPSAVSPSSARAPKAQSGLKAGYSDDNEQFNFFTNFLERYSSAPHYELAVQERIFLRIKDASGRAVANAAVKVKSGGETLAAGRSYADGSYAIYPLEYKAGAAEVYQVEVTAPNGTASATVDRKGPRSLTLALSGERVLPVPLPVDVLFVMDTTGSMGEEIERLRSTIEIIYTNITALKPKPALRFGMVLYRDREDDYLTQVLPFTSNLDAFQKELDEIDAGGGGDTPEDLQSALREAVRGMKWNKDGIRLGFVITDAPAHLDYRQDYTYASAAREARELGIKLFGIGTGGLPLEGEYLLRQVAQYTQAKYIFLTYGEGGEAEGGKEGSVSHHTGTNFTTDKLEAVVIKFVKEEISRQSDKPIDYDEAYYAAQRIADESREDTLAKLFEQSLQNLSDYSGYRLGPETRCAVMPLAFALPENDQAGSAGLAVQAEYFGSQLALSASKSKLFTLVERKDLQSILKELELQLSGLADEDAAAKVGKLLGAEILVSGSLFRKDDRYEIFLKLLRVETAEVLAATKAKVDLKLGL